MQPAEPCELRVLKSGDAAKDLLLRAVLQLGLEADHVVERAKLVVLAQLDDGMGFHGWIVRIGEPDRLHRAVAQRFAAALRHHFDRQAPIEVRRIGFPLLEVGLLARQQRIDEGVVLLFSHRAIDVVGAGAAGTDLVVARLKPRHRHVDGILVHDRRNCIEERQRVFIRQVADRIRQRRRGEGTGRNDDIAPVRGRQAIDFSATDLDSGVVLKALVTAPENPSRSTASAPPAGTWLASAARMISEPKRRISACSSPTALLAASSERNELEQTSSARPSVRCASVIRWGRISCSTTRTPALATCHAASEPARPAPMM